MTPSPLTFPLPTQLSPLEPAAVAAEKKPEPGPRRQTAAGKGREASIADVATKASPLDRDCRGVRDKFLRIRMSAEELRQLPRGRGRTTWARHVLLQVAAGTRKVRPDLQTTQRANALSAWIGTLLDELRAPGTEPMDRARAIEEAATLVARQPDLLDDKGGGSC